MEVGWTDLDLVFFVGWVLAGPGGALPGAACLGVWGLVIFGTFQLRWIGLRASASILLIRAALGPESLSLGSLGHSRLALRNPTGIFSP